MNKNNIDIMFDHAMKDKTKQIPIPINNTHRNTHHNTHQNKNYKVKNLTHLKNNKTIQNSNNSNNTKKMVKMAKDMIAKMNLGNDVEIEKILGIDIQNNSNSNTNKNKNTNTNTIQKILNISDNDFKNLSPEKLKEMMSLLENYIKMDKTFLIKHEELKKLYTEYSTLYNKKIETIHDGEMKNGEMKNGEMKTGEMKNGEMKNTKIEDETHKEMLKTIHNEMKDNNTNLYRSRLMILKKIKEAPELEPVVKNKLCGSLLAIFKSQPKSDYKQLPMLDENNKKITVKELDHAYLQKHNELMTVYKAYQTLFNKTVDYKDEIDKYKQLPTGSLISRNQMDKLIADQGFVMNMIDKMQDQLIDKNIISTIDKVPNNPVASHPQNIETFNNTMRDQIRHIIDRRTEVNPTMQTKIENLLSKYQNCDSNDTFCQAGRKLLLIKKM